MITGVAYVAIFGALFFPFLLGGVLIATVFEANHKDFGKLYAIAGQAERARDCHEKALDGYLQSAQRGEVLYYHHLADYYAGVAKDGAQAVTWARADLQLRENYSTQAALAWAFYRGRQFGKACNWIDRALASGAVEAHLFFRTAGQTNRPVAAEFVIEQIVGKSN